MDLDLDGTGKAEIDTGVGFFNHMLELIARHALIDLRVQAEGDLEVDYHHTVEDVGIALGQAVAQALGGKAGIRRYGFFLLTMDECLARAALDLGGRAFLVYQVEVPFPMVKDFNVALLREFFQGFANNAGANVHLKLEYGEEPHHAAEAVCKAFARALDMALTSEPRLGGAVFSTKGRLQG